MSFLSHRFHRSFSYHATNNNVTASLFITTHNFFGELKALCQQLFSAVDFFNCQVTPSNKVVLPDYMLWDRSPIRRKHHRGLKKSRKCIPNNSRASPQQFKHLLLVALVVLHYYLGTCRSSPDIIFSDTLILFSVCKSSYKVSGFLIDYLSSKARNKLAHSINGNHPSSTSPSQISLDSLVPPADTLTELFLSENPA